MSDKKPQKFTGFNSVGDFIDFAAHELRSPLTNIKIYSELLKTKTKDTLDPKTHTYFTVVDDKTNLLVRRINLLSDYLKIKSGDIILKPENQFIQPLLVDLAAIHPQVHLDIPAAVPLFTFDPLWLNRVLGELILFMSDFEPANNPIALRILEVNDSFYLFFERSLDVKPQNLSLNNLKTISTLKPYAKNDLALVLAAAVVSVFNWSFEFGSYQNHLIGKIKLHKA
ncbi:MAG TPA: histidine kinase dimerization/phospho-acceptor domain-containing protein [Patescibacteria group bacterium]